MEVRLALKTLLQWLSDAGVTSDDLGAVELVVGEVLNNAVEHAYGSRRNGRIDVECQNRGGTLRFEVRDGGAPLPELSLPQGKPPTVDCAASDLPEGGFGWFLVRSLAESIDYHRLGGINMLQFRIALSPPSGCTDSP